ncbi:MAG: divergent polysaccharide deacetylase family protein [Firmicutes bacterium]|nr:divergent polysaccharide deacetylase family protein [Bacillota bacterium]
MSRAGEPRRKKSPIGPVSFGVVLLLLAFTIWQAFNVLSNQGVSFRRREVLERNQRYTLFREGGKLVYDFTPAAQKIRGAVNSAFLRLGLVPSEITLVEETVPQEKPVAQEKPGTASGREPEMIWWLGQERQVLALATSQHFTLDDYINSIRQAISEVGGELFAVDYGVDRLPEAILQIGWKESLHDRQYRLVAETLVLKRTAGSRLGLHPALPPIAGEPDISPPLPGERLRPPKVAIVIDDWGYARAASQEMLDLPVQLTMAVIPFLPESTQMATEGAQRGWEVILHLPMQPVSSGLRLEKGTITTNMTDQEIQQLVAEELAAVPGVVGVNNHMGSLATEDRRVMRAVLSVVKEKGLFFLDSRTAVNSVIPEVAREEGIPFGENFLFLDNVNRVEQIDERLKQLMKIALRNGDAIGIGHVRPDTARAIEAMLPEFKANGVELVKLSDLVLQNRGKVGSFPAEGASRERAGQGSAGQENPRQEGVTP